MTETQPRPAPEPDWPAHRDDAPAPEDPRSLRRSLVAGGSVVLMTLALVAAGPWSRQAGGMLLGLGWIAAVGFGMLAYRGRPPVVIALTKVAVVTGMVALVAAVFLFYIGLQVRAVLGGTVVFGTAGSGCTVEGDAQVFTQGEPAYQVAHPSRTITAGETITLTMFDDDVLIARGSSVAGADFDCLGAPLEPLPPGAYEVILSVGGEPLAVGGFGVESGE